MKHKKLFIILICFLLIILIVGFIALSAFCFLPKPAEMEEITPTLNKSFVITDENKPTPSCHASTICEFNGKLYVAWFGGTGESKPDVTIWLSYKDGDSFSTPKNMSEIENIAHWNPVLFVNNNRMYLFYKIGLHPDNWTTYVRSTTDGESWTDEKLMIENDTLGRGPVKNKPITLSNGTVLAPASIEYTYKFPDVFVDISTDMITWQKGQRISVNPFVEILQPAICEIEPGHVCMYLRTNCQRIYFCESFDYGKTWSKASPTSLYNNNSGIDVAINSDGVIALACNPVKEDWGDRYPLIVALSYDNGKTWTKKVVLESKRGEFSYPAIIAINSTFYVTYTYNRSLIAYTEITL